MSINCIFISLPVIYASLIGVDNTVWFALDISIAYCNKSKYQLVAQKN